MNQRKPSVLLVDGYSLIFRGFHALPLLSSAGVYTNAVQGFFSMLFKALADIRPDSLCVMMDMHAPTFRHTLYEEYKGTRKPMPEELRPQIPLVRELLEAMGIAILEMEGYEADDLLGTAAKLAQNQNRRAYILTGDRDSLQLVEGDIRVILTKTGISESLLLDEEKVKELYGFTPAQVPDMKGLMGDSSDNIPGIAGIGEKTALKLIQEYGTLENVLEHAHEVKGKLGEKLQAGREVALLSRELGTICTTVPLEVDFDACSWEHLGDALPMLAKYQLNRLSQSLKTLTGQGGEKPAGTKEVQGPAKPKGEAAPAQEREASEASPQEPIQVPVFPALQDQGRLESQEAAARVAGEAAAYCAENRAALALHLGADEATLCLRDGRCWHIPMMVDLTLGGLYEDQLLQALYPALEKTPLILHGAKAFFGKLARHGLPLPTVQQDTMMGAYLLHPGQKGFGFQASLEEEYGAPPEAPVTAFDLYALALRQGAVLQGKNMMDLLRTMEQPLTMVLFEMEQAGFGIDVNTLDELGAQFTAEIESLTREVYRLTGVSDFNLNSPKQLGEVLFDRLGLPAGKKGKAGAYSTDASVLESLAELHPAIEPLLRYRKLAKLQSTYIEGLRKVADKTGRVHTTFDQTGAVTGRISSQEPNLQNIPIRSEEGREIRKAFVAREGFVLLDADYSQIELRVLAHLSGDAAMKDAFLKGQDIHTRTAAEIYGIPLEAVTAQMRRSAKAVNFGIVYGISGFGLARNIGISRKEADSFIATYFERYPGVHAFMDRMVKLGYGRGYVETLFHRRRELPELTSSNRNVRAFGERAAMNTPVQGTAADIIKMAMVRVRDQLRSGGFQARLILQVHDELVVECPVAEVQPVSRLVQEAMETVAKLSVPLVAEVSAGKNWFEAH
ncbi:MAG: DNA polymerase I [Candidatus Limiplasma sp.]|nr:DNA polymerase I [Candidatus Limiplasma sp.]